MAIPETVGLVEAFGSILKIFQVIKESDQSVSMKAQLTELYGAIVSGQQSALQSTIQQQALLHEKNQLEEELTRMKRWEEEKKRYQLHDAVNGFCVYALKEACHGTEIAHWICTKCYGEGIPSILQPGTKDQRALVFCPTCHTEFHAGQRRIGPAEYVAD